MGIKQLVFLKEISTIVELLKQLFVENSVKKNKEQIKEKKT